MYEHHCADWHDFKQQVEKLRANYRMSDLVDNRNRPSPLSFRGQASKEWPLATTLERAGHHEMTLLEYGRLMAVIYPEISTVTNRNFVVPSFPEYEAWLTKAVNESYLPTSAPLGIEFMVYLRQHGFPSPLLDWTDSEFVASYFAFEGAPEDDPDHCVAIYAFVEYPRSGKISSPLAPAIVGTGPLVKSHPRHFTQQARYTYCRRYDQEWKYVGHQLVFDGDPASLSGHQDALYKFTLPASERREVMKELQRFNITAWTLFQTEESLMKTMAFKAL
jgi:hypothetical protein